MLTQNSKHLHCWLGAKHYPKCHVCISALIIAITSFLVSTDGESVVWEKWHPAPGHESVNGGAGI